MDILSEAEVRDQIKQIVMVELAKYWNGFIYAFAST